MFRKIREGLSSWAGSGHWLAVIFKTALTHSIVWVGSTVAGMLLGALLLMGVLGMHPVWAWGLGLVGDRLGARFYLDREILGEDADFWRGDAERYSFDWWRMKADAFVDWALPAFLSTLALYYGAQIFGLLSVGWI